MKYIWLVLALVFFVMALWLMMQTVRCKKPVRAIFVDVHVLKSAGMKDYFPIFQYEYDGIDYKVRSVQSFSLRYVRKHFAVDESYTVYVDPEKPRNVAVHNKPRPADYLVLFIAVVCFGLFLAV